MNKLSFEDTNPINADAEILEDFYQIHSMDTRKEPDKVKKILQKYGYDVVDANEESLYQNALDFKSKINADESLTWRRVKLMDVGLLDGVLEKLSNKG